MAKKQSKPVKSVNLYPNRDRAVEIAEGKFTCPIESCKVTLKFRMIKPHVTKKHSCTGLPFTRKKWWFLRLDLW